VSHSQPPLFARTPEGALRHSLRDLMEAHGAYVTRHLRRLGVAEADLPDLRQDTFLVVHRQLPSFEGRSTLRTWIAGIVTRLASDYRARAYRRRERPGDELPEVAVDAGQQSWLESREGFRLMDAVLGDLRAEQREVFVLYELENLPMFEVALRVECPVSTAYARLHAARKAVRVLRLATFCSRVEPPASTAG
jgi:RNA polymerase sigma-70 factor (ECF subfamily)